jgi:hypothetical protein
MEIRWHGGELLELLRECILLAHQKTEHLTQAVEAVAKVALPPGLGALSNEELLAPASGLKLRRLRASQTLISTQKTLEHGARPAHRLGEFSLTRLY